MARLTGTSGQVTLVTTGGTENEVLGVTQWSADPQANEIESTGMDSQGWAEYLGGVKSYTGTIELHWDSAEDMLSDDIEVGNTIDFSLLYDAGEAALFTGTAIITGGPTPTVAHNGSVDATVNFRGTGELNPA
jgi:hypothetical protein